MPIKHDMHVARETNDASKPPDKPTDVLVVIWPHIHAGLAWRLRVVEYGVRVRLSGGSVMVYNVAHNEGTLR